MKTVLVAEDSPSQRECISHQLRWRGMKVIPAADGMDALEQIQTQRPDLAILDIVMPRIDGYGVCRLIKANPETRHLPVVILTGKGKQIALQQGIKHAEAYIGKPWQPRELVNTVKRVLSDGCDARDRTSAEVWVDYGLLILQTIELYDSQFGDRTKSLITILKLYDLAISAFERALTIDKNHGIATSYYAQALRDRDRLNQLLIQTRPCPTCHYYHGKDRINCAVHPFGRPELLCRDWQRWE